MVDDAPATGLARSKFCTLFGMYGIWRLELCAEKLLLPKGGGGPPALLAAVALPYRGVLDICKPYLSLLVSGIDGFEGCYWIWFPEVVNGSVVAAAA